MNLGTKLVGLPLLTEGTLKDFTQLFFAKHKASQAWWNLWVTERLDAVLTLVAPHTAVSPDTWTASNLAGLFNLLGCPALVIPVGTVQECDIRDQNAKYGTADEAVYKLYTSPSEHSNAPTCLQLVGEPQNDEKFLSMARAIDSILNPFFNEEEVSPNMGIDICDTIRETKADHIPQASGSSWGIVQTMAMIFERITRSFSQGKKTK